jgi:unspecific monooxygenase
MAVGAVRSEGDRSLEQAFAPWDLSFVTDPYPVYAELRERAPVLYHEATDHWLIARYEDVEPLLRDRRLGRTYLHVSSHQDMGRPEEPDWHAPFWRLIRGGILDMEPPDHTRVRRLVSKAFTPKMVEGLRPAIQAAVDDLLDAAEERGSMDLVHDLAEPLSVRVIAEMLGVPDADRHLLRPWSSDICGMYELNPSIELQQHAVRASVEFTDYMGTLAAERRSRPQDDLITALTQVLDEGDRLTEDELIGTCVLLLNAGHEATVNVTGIGWMHLLRRPDQLAVIREDPTLLPCALEEVMRFDTPLQMFERWVLEDLEVAGTRIPKGAELGLLFGSANRDPAVFERPDELDVTRRNNPHITFGGGSHFCLGAPLARLELAVSFRGVLDRFPNLALAEEPAFRPAYIVRGLEGLPVTF